MKTWGGTYRGAWIGMLLIALSLSESVTEGKSSSASSRNPTSGLRDLNQEATTRFAQPTRACLVAVALDLVKNNKGGGISDYTRSLFAEALVIGGYHDLATEIAAAIKDSESRDGAFYKIVEVQLAQGAVDQAAQNTLKMMGESYDRDQVLQDIVDYALSTLRLTLADELVRQIQDGYTRDEVLSAIAVKQAETGNHATALRRVKTVKRDYHRDNALIQIAGFQAKNGDVAGAIIVAKTIKEPYYRAKALCAAVRALAGPGTSRKARVVIDIALDDALLLEPRGQVSILAVIAETQAVTVTQVESRNTLARARKIAATIEHHGARSVALEDIAAAYATNGESADAHAIVRGTEFSDQDDEARVWLRVGKALAGASKRKEGLETFRIAHSVVKDSQDVLRDSLLGEIAQAQAEVGDFPSALQTANDMKFYHDRDKTLTAIVSAQKQVGDFKGAVKTANRIEFPLDRASTLSEIALAQLEAGKRAASLSAIRAARTTAHELGRPVYRVKALATVAYLQAAAGEQVEALRTFTEALKVAGQINYEWAGRSGHAKTLAAIAKAQAKAGLEAEARQTFTAALDVAKGIKSLGKFALLLIQLSNTMFGESEIQTRLL